MRRKIQATILLIALLISSLGLSGCSTSTFDEESSNKLERDVYDLYEELKQVFDESDSEYDVTSYLYEWAEENELVARKLSGGNLMITKPASVADPTFPSTIIQCAISRTDAKQSSQKASIALATVLNLKENGKVSVLFTITKDGEFTGAKRLSVENLDSNYFIHLESGEKSAVNNGSAGTAEYEMSLNYEMAPPTTTNAYMLTISGLPQNDSGIITGTNPNAILILSNFLIGCRASGMLVELVDFDGGTRASVYPGSANVVIMVNQNNEARLLSRFASSQEKFLDKYENDFPDVAYTLTPIEPAAAVIDNDDAANMLSLLYTTINGVYKTSEEDDNGTTLAVANIGKLTTENNLIKIGVMARSVDENVLMEMADAYHATAYLSDATFQIVEQTTIWPFDPEHQFSMDFITLAKDTGLKKLSVSPTFLTSECVIFYGKKKDINMISFSVNNYDSFLDAKTLLFFITNLVHTPM
jgi:dipeptidase D